MVVQETLVSHLSPSHNLGIALALGLVSGKSAAFLSGLVSLPLADRFGDAVPFTLAVLLCAMSFIMNWLRLQYGWGKYEGREVVKKKVEWQRLDQLGDIYWVYILLYVPRSSSCSRKRMADGEQQSSRRNHMAAVPTPLSKSRPAALQRL